MLAGRHANFSGTLTGGEDVVTCPISGLTLLSDGHTGFTCADLNAQLATYYAAITAPRIVMLNIGTNDLLAVLAQTETMAQAKADFNTCLSTLIGLDQNMIFFISTVLNFPGMAGMGLIESFNDNIATQITTHRQAGRTIYNVDMFTALSPIAEPATGADFNSGTVHPNAQGYYKMAVRWADYLSLI